MSLLTVEDVAFVVHSANRSLRMATGQDGGPIWDELSPDKQASACDGVRQVLLNPGLTPEALHQKWVDYKAAQGWKYGPVEDAEKKEHPCMKPFEELSVADQIKDALFLGVVNSLRGAVHLDDEISPEEAENASPAVPRLLVLLAKQTDGKESNEKE